MRISGVAKQSIVDGPGLRFTLFTQGCPHHCPHCHNPQTHDSLGGYEIDSERVLSEFRKNPLLSGITFSGGEPILQAKELIPIAKEVIAMGKTCIIYSGFTFEELLAKKDEDILTLLSLCYWLVDGTFIQDEKDLKLQFRGSRNQRIIDLPPSLASGYAVIAETDD